jgi:hypothetical protein
LQTLPSKGFIEFVQANFVCVAAVSTAKLLKGFASTGRNPFQVIDGVKI